MTTTTTTSQGSSLPNAPRSTDASLSMDGGELTTCERDPITPFAHDVLDLFHGVLSATRFPDLDRDVLDAFASRAIATQLEVEAQERALEVARVQAEEAQQQLVQRAQRALAYARVFAMGDAELEEAVAGVRAEPARLSERRDALPRREVTPVEAPRKRGRPRKDSAAAGLLPIESRDADSRDSDSRDASTDSAPGTVDAEASREDDEAREAERLERDEELAAE